MTNEEIKNEWLKALRESLREKTEKMKKYHTKLLCGSTRAWRYEKWKKEKKRRKPQI